jgi:integrase
LEEAVATVRKRVGPQGTRFEAVIRLKRNGIQIHRESRTFDTRDEAKKWAGKREEALNNPAAAALDQTTSGEGPTLASLIRWYIDNFGSLTPWGRTKQTTLEYLERHNIGKLNAATLAAPVLVDHIRARRAAGAAPCTASNDLTWIGCVLQAAKDSGDYPSIKPAVVRAARTTCNKLRLIGKSRRREVRPTAEQLAQLTEYFRRRDRRSRIPMTDIMWFAIHSARREAEICRLRRQDNEFPSRTGLVRDAKHPTRKQGNHRRFKYTPEAWEIIERQPKRREFIFPFKPQSISTAFTRACKVLGIDDLVFHDLRHEATSRLFERGYTIPEVAQFTLHESWNELKRYTHLLRKNLRDLPDPKARLTQLANRSVHDLPVAA